MKLFISGLLLACSLYLGVQGSAEGEGDTDTWRVEKLLKGLLPKRQVAQQTHPHPTHSAGALRRALLQASPSTLGEPAAVC